MRWQLLITALTLAIPLTTIPFAAIAEPLPSGTTFLSDDLKARQADEAANPGMLWVLEGAERWQTAEGTAGRSCRSCHGDASASMRGVATRYPEVDRQSGTLINLEGRINKCRTDRMTAPSLPYESDGLLALTAFIAHQSKGLPMNVAVDGPASAYLERGKAFFHRRRGQLNLSCAQCHAENAGRTLRGDKISHAVPNGYPAYRLEWQSLGSLHRRLRSCSQGVRAVQHDYGSQTYLELELYLAARAKGTAIETPAIRR